MDTAAVPTPFSTVSWTAVVCLTLCRVAAVSTHRPYVAAVYQHRPRNPEGPVEPATVRNNLADMRKAADLAARHGAEIIVYPEMAVLPFSTGREEIAPLLEEVPDPEESRNPCLEDRPEENMALTDFSCTARRNAMYVVGNLGRKERCHGHPGCPPDGHYHFNTNVVFDREGTLIARYDKYHLFLEPAYDAPSGQKPTVFSTDFGTFGTFTCFDILYPQAAKLVEDFNLTAIAYPTWWFDERPFLTAIQVQESWALRLNVTLLAANVYSPSRGSTGSGIYEGEKGATAYIRPNEDRSVVLISRVGNSSQTPLRIVVSDDDETVTYRSYEFDPRNATLVKLNESSGLIEASLDDLRCRVFYQTASLPQGYYLMAVNQLRGGGYNRYFWCEESCILVRCDDDDRRNCSSFPLESRTVFRSFRLEGHFRSRYVYPNVMSSHDELLPAALWKFEREDGRNSLESKGSIDRPLLSVSLYGRCYHRDPPYVP